ncbi:purine-nucleoside phosphorylase [Collinsella sp. An2]|uniref:purine-nucleoside phosphorylase n=1 Tax=Collinsella sp. An2 TaxID=1965585 RepID=UPI000B36E89D|nr:purine-nucleoside phosphorylase [Collinsella sp. An2]OUP09522.1 purine-nucleoside phosphorylase [Collinsella sp. An2]
MPHTPTPHNAAHEGDFAPIVLMPGDPLRAKYIADTYLDDCRQVTAVRGMLGFTGTYKGKPVSVMGHGMGMPSIGIYSYELYHNYDVEAIIRVGSAGGYADDLQLRDVVAAQGACTDSNYAFQFNLPGTFAPIADFGMLSRAVEVAKERGVKIRVGNVLSSDVFYDGGANERAWKPMGVLATEMESAALYMNAAAAGKRALCLLTISDIPSRGLALPAEERQTSFNQMLEVALETAITC